MRTPALNPEPILVETLFLYPHVKLDRLIRTTTPPSYIESYPKYEPLVTIIQTKTALKKIISVTWQLIFWTTHQNQLPYAQSYFRCGPNIKISSEGIYIKLRLVTPPDYYYVDYNRTKILPLSSENFRQVLNFHIQEAISKSPNPP